MLKSLLGQRFFLVVGCVALVAAWCNPAPARAADAPALASQVQIRRTTHGVPHIQGQSLAAASFGFAYCQAEDHLTNVLMGIVGTRGQLAQHFGPGKDNKNIEADFFTRQFRVYPRALETYHKLDPDYRDMCEGFAAGLNYYVERHPQIAPAWAPKVTGHDVAAYGLAGVMRFAFNRSDIIKDFLKTQNAATAMFDAVSDSDEELVGSNMWAFAPNRSKSGRALLMGNPHQGWAPVSTYYEAHMTVPGKLNFYGSTFIGRPILTSGWNEFLGWSHTVNYPDLEEVYELEIDPAQPDSYRLDGGSVPLTRDDVTIRVKTDAGDETLTRTFWHSPLGPIIHRKPGKSYVLRSACYENYRAYEQWLRMTQAHNYAEFRQAVAMNQVPMFNICYADRVGNISYLWNGTVPNLPHPAHKAEAVPVARSAEIWTRFHTTDELPQLFNPPGGYVQNCNSPPFFTSLAAPLDPAKFPLHFRTNDVSLRTQLSLRLIHGDQKLSLEDICAMKFDNRMLLAERVKPDLLKAIRASNPSAEWEPSIKAIEEWDGTTAVESRGGTLFANWWDRYYDKGKGKYTAAWNPSEATTTPRGLADQERAVRAFGEAVAEVQKLYGRPDVAWGEVHRLRKGKVDLPVAGGSGLMGCFRVLDFKRAEDNKLVISGGDSWIFAVEFSDPPKAYTVVGYSQSDVEGSPYFSDQAALFAGNKLKRAAFTEPEIQAQLVKTYGPGEE